MVHHLPAAQALSPLTWLSILVNLPKLKRLEMVDVTGIRHWMTRGENEEFSHVHRVYSSPTCKGCVFCYPYRIVLTF